MITVPPLVPKLPHLVLSGRRELGTSCSNLLHSVGICLKSSHTFYSLPLEAKTSLKMFLTIIPCILTSQPYLPPVICQSPMLSTAFLVCLRGLSSHFCFYLLAKYMSWPLELLVLDPFCSCIIACAWLCLCASGEGSY